MDRGWKLTACGITMTGELADCFFDRVSGVKHIVNQVSQAFERLALDSPLFYAVDGGFLTAEASRGAETLLAASNWHALGSFVARTQTKDCYLIDIGSTTADLIPIAGGTVATSATTDFERLERRFTRLRWWRTHLGRNVGRYAHIPRSSDPSDARAFCNDG